MIKSVCEPREMHQNFLAHVYSLMAFGLSLTGVVAYAIYATPTLFFFFLGNPFMLIVLFLAQIGLVIGISTRVASLSWQSSFGLFTLYATIMGITMSSIFITYPIAIIYKTFFICAFMFGSLALYGYYTRTDLSGIGAIAGLALMGLLGALIINLFFASTKADLIISLCGVILFSLLTAYDAQKLTHIGSSLNQNNDTSAKIAVIGALTLYLDFLNLFLFLLRFTGSQRK